MAKLHPKIIEQLKDIHRTLPNVNGFSEELKDEIKNGVKTGRKAVRVYVTKKRPLSELAAGTAVPDVIGDENGNPVPVDVVEIGEIKALTAPPFVDPTGTFRPLIGGVSVGHYQITAGTLNYFYKDNATGKFGILSNNHVLANENLAKIGDPILQPAPYDSGTVANDTVAHLTRFIPISYLGQPSTCINAKWYTAIYNGLARALSRKTRLQAISTEAITNSVDCAFAILDNQSNYTFTENGLFSPVGTAEATDGDIVTKSGRTTGVTRGTVIDTAGTISVNYGGTNVATFTGQIIVQDMTTPFSQGGDSGSLIMRESDQAAVGLLFAGGGGTTIANHINVVLAALDIGLI